MSDAMRKPAKFLAVLLIGSLIGFASWQLLRLPEAEPVYRGKKLTTWLAAGQLGPSGDADEWMRFNDWIRERTPFLVRVLKTRDSALRRPYLWIKTKAPAFVATRMPVWLDPQKLRLSATYWLGQQGPMSKAAVPGLCELTATDPNGEVSRGAIWALTRIDLESENVRNALVVTLATDADPKVRAAAAGGLEMSRAVPSKEIIFAFARGLRDRDSLVREICSAGLGKCGSRAKVAWDLIHKLANSDDEAADYARNALKEIESATTEEANGLRPERQ
jgi:HEAT repeat protein